MLHIPRTLRSVGVVLWLAHAVDARGVEPTPAPQVLEQAREQRLAERDRLGVESQRLAESGQGAAALDAARRMLDLEIELFGNSHADVAGSYQWIGDLQRDQGRLDEAIESYQRSFSVLEATPGTPPWQLVDVREGLASLRRYRSLASADRDQLAEADDRAAKGTELYQQGDYAGSLKELTQALEIRRRILGDDHSETTLLVGNIGLVRRALGDFAGARQADEQALAVTLKRFGEDHPRTAVLLNNLAALEESDGRFLQAAALLDRALTITRHVYGEASPETADVLDNLGGVQKTCQEFPEARSSLEQAYRIRVAQLGDDDPATGKSLQSLGDLEYAVGNFAAAQARYDESLAVVRKALGEEHPLTGEAWARRGHGLLACGRLAEATTAYERSLQIRQTAFGELNPDAVATLDGLAEAALAAGDAAGAQSRLEQSLSITRREFGDDHPDVALAMLNLGRFCSDAHQWELAQHYLQESLERSETAFGKHHQFTTTALNNLGVLARRSGDLASARSYLERALAIQQAQPSSPAEEALVLANLGDVSLEAGDAAAAQGRYANSLSIRRKAFGAKHPDVVAAQASLALALARMGDFSAAWKELSAADAAQQRLLQRELAALNDGAMVQYLNRSSPIVDLVASLPVEQLAIGDAATDLLLTYKAVAFEVLNRRAAGLQIVGGDAETRELHRDLLDAQAALEALAIRAPAELSSAQVSQRRSDLQRRCDDLESRFNRRLAAATGASESLAVTTAEIRKALPADAALVEFLAVDPFAFAGRNHWKSPDPGLRYLAVVVRSEYADAVWIDLGPAAEIEDLATALHEQVHEFQRFGIRLGNEAGAEESYRQVARRLGEKIMTPLEAAVDGAKVVFLAPDRRLHEIPFEALVDERGAYLVETDRQFAYLNSGRDLLRSPAPPGSGVYVFAGPNFDADARARLAERSRQQQGLAPTNPSSFAPVASSTAADLRALLEGAEPARSYETRLGWRKLPGADREGEEAARAFADAGFNEVHVLTGDAALEEAVKRLRRPRVVVFVTHGDFLATQPGPLAAESKPRAAALMADAADTRGGASAARASLRTLDNPLLRSYIVLAGANKLDEDLPANAALENGWLTAQEIGRLDLRGSDLVVLSACNTSRGDVDNGQAVTGMRSAFLFAGARTVVGSLYEVPNVETRELLGPFYAGVAAGRGKLASLHAAKREFLEARRVQRGAAHPFFWASFVLVGEP